MFNIMKRDTKKTEWPGRKMLVACFVCLYLFSVSAWASNGIAAQTVTATFKNATLKDVIWELQKQTDFTFVYSTNDVQKVKVEDMNVMGEEVIKVLNKCLENTGLTYTVHNGVVAIKSAETNTVAAVAPQQKVTVTGQVVDASGDPMPGVSVQVKGMRLGNISDINGRFTIDVPQGERIVLLASFIGYASKEVNAVPGRTVKIVLEEDAQALEEVIITGYGTFKKSAYAGSASTIKMKEKEDVPAVDFKSLLRGSAPGVQVSESSGALGGTSSVTIRGLGSFNASTSPLYVIDGVPVMTSINSSMDAGTDIMSTINTSDIENITVIKDAAAASLYGSRAANGVIIITTKSGKEGKPVFNFKTDFGFSNYSTPFREVMGGEERRETFWEGLYNQARYLNGKNEADATKWADDNIDKWAPRLTAPEGIAKGHPDYDKWASIINTGYEDWENALFNDSAPYQNYEFSISGGDKKTSYFTSISYNDQGGLVRQQSFDRLTGRANMKYKMTDYLELGANILYSRMTQLGSSETLSYTSPMYSSRHKVSPSDPIFNQDGTYNVTLLENGKRNPKSALDFNTKTQKIDRSFNTFFANLTILKGLVFNTTFSFDHTNSHYKSWTDPRSTDGASDNGSLSVSNYQHDQMVWKNNLSYDTRINQKHHIDFLAGYEVHEYKRSYIYGSAIDFPTVEKRNLSNAGQITGLSEYDEDGWRLISYLSRLNYDYDGKYYLGASARMDGSSRLHRDSRWGAFWSVSGAWRFSSEPFMAATKSFLDDARLRASYGSNGTLPSKFYGYMDLVSFEGKYNGKAAITDYQIGQKNLKWEKNYNLNVGLDFRIFDRFGATFEVYSRESSDLLMDYPLSRTIGFSTMLTNIGRVKNEGIEVEMNADIFRNKNFSWNSSLNFGHNRNKIVNLGDQTEITGSSYIRKVGEPYYRYYVKEFAGINPETGYPMYYINGDDGTDADGNRLTTETASEASYIMYKSPEPKLAGGWTNSFKAFWFDLSFTTTFTLGGYSYDQGAAKLEHAGKSEKGAIQTLYRDRWRQPGDQTDIEMFMVGNPYNMASVVSSRRVHSSDHLRLKNLTFGVSAPKKYINRFYVQSLRVYFSGTNLITLAGYKNYDPEIPRDGIVDFEAPKMRTFTFGVDIKF